MAKIISANYRDRGSKYKWLIRESQQDPTEALECREVRASQVRFLRSSGIEEGFGCAIVAEAFGDIQEIGIEPAKESFEIPETAVELRFNGYDGFYVKAAGENSENILTLKSVHLTKHGQIFGVL